MAQIDLFLEFYGDSIIIHCIMLQILLMEISKIFTSVGIIILGAFIAGARDLSFDSYGYAIVFVANICTAVYLASIARIGTILSYVFSCLVWKGSKFLSANMWYFSQMSQENPVALVALALCGATVS